ncbi:LysE family translocator [Paenibacillus sp. CAU 1782]
MDHTSFLIYCMITTLTPGPTNIVILSTAHKFGARQAMSYTFGATIGIGLLLALSAALNTALITVIPKLMIMMQIVGSLYMFYLAYQLYKTDKSSPETNQSGTFLSGFAMQFLNPKVLLFTLTVIPTFVMPYYNEVSAISISIFVITLIGFLAFATWVVFGTMFKTFLQRHFKTVNILMALFLAYAAVMIWI